MVLESTEESLGSVGDGRNICSKAKQTNIPIQYNYSLCVHFEGI